MTIHPFQNCQLTINGNPVPITDLSVTANAPGLVNGRATDEGYELSVPKAFDFEVILNLTPQATYDFHRWAKAAFWRPKRQRSWVKPTLAAVLGGKAHRKLRVMKRRLARVVATVKRRDKRRRGNHRRWSHLGAEAVWQQETLAAMYDGTWKPPRLCDGPLSIVADPLIYLVP